MTAQKGGTTAKGVRTEGSVSFDPFDYDKGGPATLGPPSMRAQLTVEACRLLQQMSPEDAIYWIEQGRKLAERQAQGGRPDAATRQA